MPWQIAWTKRGRLEFRNVLKYCLSKDVDWAERAEMAIAEGIEFLAETPFISSVFVDGSRGEIREYLIGQFRLFFQVIEDENVVLLNAIRHVRQQDPDFSEE